MLLSSASVGTIFANSFEKGWIGTVLLTRLASPLTPSCEGPSLICFDVYFWPRGASHLQHIASLPVSHPAIPHTAFFKIYFSYLKVVCTVILSGLSSSIKTCNTTFISENDTAHVRILLCRWFQKFKHLTHLPHVPSAIKITLLIHYCLFCCRYYHRPTK